MCASSIEASAPGWERTWTGKLIERFLKIENQKRQTSVFERSDAFKKWDGSRTIGIEGWMRESNTAE
jgi:hypothetical protein